MNIIVYSAIAGMIAGALIAGIGMVYSAATGRGFWSLPNNIGGIVLGPEAGAGRGFGVPTLTGVMFHMVLSAIYGIATYYIAKATGLGYVTVGFAIGMAVWIGNHYGVGAFHAGAREHARYNPLWLAFALHAIWGVVTGMLIDRFPG